MTDDVRIRPTSAHDAEAIAALLDQLGYPTDGVRVGERMKRLATNGDDARGAIFVATDRRSHDPVGLLALHRFAALARRR